MLYMALSSFVMVMSIGVIFSHMKLNSGTQKTAWDFTESLAIPLLTMALVSPFAVSLSNIEQAQSLDGLSRLSVGLQWAGLLASMGLFALFIRRAWLAPRRFWFCGAIVATLLLTFIFANSLWFVSGSGTGVVSPFVLGERENSDVNCPRETMLVHYNRGAPSEWRCPTGMMLMAGMSRPFLPWPDYRSGRSQQLSDAISTIMDSAHSAKGGQKP
ncbi:hypothetical protein QNH99_23405 (plasmid) [Pantoea allii]|uniref:hypothetical protein n=1 Tax=Pantoea allii TaxID=574096 RepID=UPI003977B4AF